MYHLHYLQLYARGVFSDVHLYLVRDLSVIHWSTEGLEEPE